MFSCWILSRGTTNTHPLVLTKWTEHRLCCSFIKGKFWITEEGRISLLALVTGWRICPTIWVQRKCVDKKLVMRWEAGRGKVDKERGDTGQGSWWWERSGNEAPSLERIRAGQFLFFPPSPWLASKGERCEVVSGKASKRGCSVKYCICPLDHWTEWVNDTVGGFWPHYPLDGSSKPWMMLYLWLDGNLDNWLRVVSVRIWSSQAGGSSKARSGLVVASPLVAPPLPEKEKRRRDSGTPSMQPRPPAPSSFPWFNH